MTLTAPIGFLNSQSGPLLTPSVILAIKESMIRGIKAEGSYPVSDKLINKLSVVLGDRDPLINDLIELILTDPVLSLRLVSLSNFPAYSRGRPALSVTSAVQQFGFRRITEIVRGLSHNRDLDRAYHDKALTIHVLSRLIAGVTISVRLSRELSPKKPLGEETMVLTVAAALPELLTAFYTPHIYSACWFDAAINGTEFPKSFRKLFLQSVMEFAKEINSALSMPKEFSGMLSLLEIPPWNKRSWGPGEGEDQKAISKSVYAGQVISQALFQYGDTDSLNKLISEISSKLFLEVDVIEQGIAEVPLNILKNADLGGFPSIRIPEFSILLNEKFRKDGDGSEQPSLKLRSKAERLVPFLGELKSAFVDELEPTEFGQLDRAVFVTLLAMVEALDFDRSVLLIPDESTGMLKAGAWFGRPSPLIENYRQKIALDKFDFKPELKAFHEARAIFSGDPLFGEDWPFAAFPIVSEGKSIAIFYGDRASNPMAQPLDTAEQVAIVALSEAWQGMPSNFR